METVIEKSANITTEVIKESFPVTGMTCAACASSVESMISNTPGVTMASVNFATNSVLVEREKSVTSEMLRQAVQAIGYDLIV
ncbi:MAG: heavy metal-associated domain-containing protein, partial [Marinoscillum sp.]